MYKIIQNQVFKLDRNVCCVSLSRQDPEWVCTVCLRSGELTHYTPRRYIKRLPCGHMYHVRCIDRWLLQNVSCPLCRESVYLPGTIPHMSMYTVFLVSPDYMNLDLVRF